MKNQKTARTTIRHRILVAAVVLLCSAATVMGVRAHMVLMNRTIYEESTAHLTEIYHQANQTLNNKVSFNWGIMRMWEPYLEIAPSDADIRSYLALAHDMILMDVQMPVMDGLEATRQIRRSGNPLGATIPILAMTANAFLEDMQKSKDAGMDEHLSKPVDLATLEQVVKRFRVPPPLTHSGKARFSR